MINCLQPLSISHPSLLGFPFPSSTLPRIIQTSHTYTNASTKFIFCKQGRTIGTHLQEREGRGRGRGRGSNIIVCGLLFPVDPWAPSIDSQSIASQLFAVSLFPYLGFLYFITKSKSAPKLTLFGFYFLLAFVGATIPAGIYAKVHYGTSLSNVDWLHGGAESLLTLTNLFIVLGLRQALRKAKNAKESPSDVVSNRTDEKTPLI